MGCIDWIVLVEDRERRWALVDKVMNIRVPLNAGNCLSRLESFSFSGRNLLHGVS